MSALSSDQLLGRLGKAQGLLCLEGRGVSPCK